MQGDCLEIMKEIPDGSVDMILTDPPYGSIKNIAGGNVLHGMKNKTCWDAIIDQQKMLTECNRILRTNGALVLFSQEPYTSKLITETHGNLPFSYRLTWLKDHFANSLIAKKAPVNYTEDVCVFFKKESELKNPAWNYTNKIFNFIGKTRKEIFNDFENSGLSKFSTLDVFNSIKSRRYNFPTLKTYQFLIDFYGIKSMNGFVEYSVARLRYDNFKASTPKIFNLNNGKKFKSNVLQYKKDYTGFHPTQKPVALLEDLIGTYTNENNIVLDFTMGSGSTGVAAKNLKRSFIGIELDENYFKIARQRIKQYS